MGEIACEAARDAWTELAETTGGRDAEEMVIHRAILAERQRCADACRRLSEHMKKRGQFQDSFTAGFIAQQISDGQHVG